MLLTDLQKILYVSEAVDGSGDADVVVPPSAKLLQMVRQQFVSNIYKGLSGMVENAEKPLKLGEASAMSDGDKLIVPARNDVSLDVHTNAIDITNRVSFLDTTSWSSSLQDSRIYASFSPYRTLINYNNPFSPR